MANYKIFYNPYSNETKIEKNGKMLNENSRLCSGIKNKRLQMWFDENPGWKGFAAELDKNNNDKACSISFFGREIDYSDLEEFFSDYKSETNTQFSLSLEARTNDSDIMDRIKSFLKDIKSEGVLAESQIVDIEETINDLEKEPFSISVIATMSSGKSTLLNALLAKKLLPMGNRATTANIVEIYDNDNDCFEMESYDANNQVVDSIAPASSEKISSINKDTNIRVLKIYGDIPFVRVGNLSLMLRDTPGPNSQIADHEEITDSLISDSKNQSAILYVMDTTKPEERSDGELLKSISKAMKAGGKLSSDRFFFVVNKVDDWLDNANEENNQTMERLLDENKKYLESFGIENPRIFPICASIALDIRTANFDTMANNIRRKLERSIENFNDDDLPEYYFEKYASVSKSVKKEIDKELDAENDEFKRALIHTGIVSLEYSLKEYMLKYAYPIKVADAVKEIKETIDEEKMRTVFLKEISESNSALEKVRNQKKELKAKKNEREKKKREYEKKINNYEIPDSEIRLNVKQTILGAFKPIIDESRRELTSTTIDVESGDRMVRKYRNSLQEISDNLDTEINELIDEKVYKKGQELFDDYQEYISSIQESINVEAFDFTKIKKLKDYFSQGINQSIDEQQDMERKQVGSHKEWQHYEYTNIFTGNKHMTKLFKKRVEVPEFTYVPGEKYYKTSDIRSWILAVSESGEKKIDDIVKHSQEQLSQYKVHFNSQVAKLGDIVESIINEIDEFTMEENVVEERKVDHEKKYNILDITVDKLENIVGLTEGN